MSSTTFTLGRNCRLNRNTASYASPTWVNVTNVRDVKVPAEKEEGDVSTRAAGFYLIAGTLIKMSVEWNMNHDTTDTDWGAFNTSLTGFSAVELYISDAAPGGTGQGWRASYEVTKQDEGQPLNGIDTTDFVAKPTMSAHAPAWVTL